MTNNHSIKLYYNAKIVVFDEIEPVLGGILVENGKIIDLGSHLNANYKSKTDQNVEFFDVKQHILAPGLIDMRVFMGEPGYEHLENIKSVGNSAAAGGVTTIITMPNTKPIIDDLALVEYIKSRAKSVCKINLHTTAAATKGLKGKEMSEIGLLKQAGAIAFTDGRKSIENSLLFKRLLTYAKSHEALIIHDVEDKNLAGDGVMNEGLFASRLGLPSKPKIAESIMLDRDLALAINTDSKYHVSQISCIESLESIKRAKKINSKISAGVSINNLVLNEFDIGEYRTFLRLEPPLRNEDDRTAMVVGIQSGDIDVIVSSHDPQDPDGKRHPFADSAVGAVGLETMLSAALRLYHSDGISITTLIKAMSLNPAKLLELDTGELKIGKIADFIIVDLDYSWKVERSKLHSKSSNTPFENRVLQGKVLQTFISGQKVFDLNDQ